MLGDISMALRFLGVFLLLSGFGVWAAERAVKSVELSIGGQRIDKHYQRWWRLYSELYLPVDKKNEWAKLTTDATGAGASKVYLPLIFFFNRNPGLALPLIALKSVGRKSIQPKASEHGFRENLLGSRDDFSHHTQMLVCCY